MLVFEARRKPEYIVPEEKPRRARREPTTNATLIWRRRRDLSPDHIGESRVLSPLRHRDLSPLLKTSDYRCLITEVIIPRRDGLGCPATVPKPKQITFCKVTNKHQTIFFTKNDYEKSWQNVSCSNCMAFATGCTNSGDNLLI